MGFIYVLVEGALAAGPNASPPLNMRRASIFTAVFACAASALVILFFRGLPDSRRSMDAAREREEKENKNSDEIEMSA